MYVAFFIIHDDFSKVKLEQFTSLYNAIRECALDKNICHMYFSSSRDVHKFDTYFKGGLFTNALLHHSTTQSKTDRQREVECYKSLVLPNPYEYHWIIKVRPDLAFLDAMIFSGMRLKYSKDSIQARARFYNGPRRLKKNEKSRWYNSEKLQQESYKFHDKELLIILDDQVYMVPVGLQYHAFRSIEPNWSNQSLWMGSISNTHPEKNQSLEWTQREIPLKIIELHFVKYVEFAKYNNGV